ncbi:MAG: FAD-dependent oxidoreductase, partial [Actinobacteria bacterium]|nr:FAD-dependent oxidoreductase [Actinomycetota bacterium]
LSRPDKLDQQDIESYARRHRVSERAIGRLLVPLSTGVFFLPAGEYSAYAFFATVAKALRRPHRMRVGAFEAGMTEVMAAPVAAAIARAGGTVRTKTSVTALEVADGKVIGVVTANERLHASNTVIATSIDVAQGLLRGPFADQEWCRPMLSLKTMSSATLQLELSKPIYPVDRTIFGPGTVLASFGEQSRTTFKHARGRVSIILSPPELFVAMEPERVFDTVMDDATKIGLDLRALVTDYRMINEPNQFYALSPGQNALRPEQKTPVHGLTLAGGYTKQAWIDTMEGAVISGQRAARAVLA